jgi:glycosyltransferase involved in cell wall biosynthesis
MRIVYISDSAIPSSSPNSVHVMKMCQAFAELGHTVTLEAKNTTACLKDVTDIHAFYAVRNNFKVNIFPRNAFKGSGAFYNASLTWRLPWIAADLIYTRSITAAFLLLLYGKAVVFEVHEPYEGKAPRIRKMFRYIIKHTRLIKLVVISDALKEYYLSNFKRSEDFIFVAHDGADTFPLAEPILKGEEFKIGYVGSLYSGKGMEILIPLAQACPQIRFHVVGGNKSQIEENQKKTKGINNLVFHGFKGQQELPSYIASFDAVIAPYTSRVVVSEKAGANNLALWMSPLKIFEYMSSGKPIVTSDLPVIREILTDGDTALLCNPSNLETWERAVTTLSKDPALRNKLSRNSLILFTEKYTWKKRAEQILEAIGKG